MQHKPKGTTKLSRVTFLCPVSSPLHPNQSNNVPQPPAPPSAPTPSPYLSPYSLSPMLWSMKPRWNTCRLWVLTSLSGWVLASPTHCHSYVLVLGFWVLCYLPFNLINIVPLLPPILPIKKKLGNQKVTCHFQQQISFTKQNKIFLLCFAGPSIFNTSF